MDLSADGTYVERNFTTQDAPEKLEDMTVFQCYVNDWTDIFADDSLFGSYYVSNSQVSTIKEKISQYVYNLDNGIYYYLLEDGQYFPIDKLEIVLKAPGLGVEDQHYFFEYHTDDESYHNITGQQETTTNNGAVISVETSSTYKTAEQMEKEILEKKDDKDFANSTFAKLSVRVKKTTKKSVKLVWKKMSGATKYVIYGAKCGTSYKKIKEVSKKTFTANKLKKGKYYKYLVVAQNDKGEVLATSKLIHVATKGGKVGNCKSLKLNKTKVKLLLGKKFKIKVKQIADSKNVKIKKHRKVSFESSNPEIATVSKRGKITALKRGKCTIYAYAQNGVYKKVKVTIK